MGSVTGVSQILVAVFSPYYMISIYDLSYAFMLQLTFCYYDELVFWGQNNYEQS